MKVFYSDRTYFVELTTKKLFSAVSIIMKLDWTNHQF